MLQIESPSKASNKFALFNLGFRPFFLLATGFGALSMLIWLSIYVHGNQSLLNSKLPSTWWHAHEMVFAYAIAVIAGFLLTAVGNWTNLPMPKGRSLMGLVALWLIARILPFTHFEQAINLMALTDLLFMLSLATAIFIPIYRTKQWNQMPIVLKVLLMAASNMLFYAALLDYIPMEMVYWGLYSGFYLVISLIMMMGRRVIPFFIERGVPNAPIQLTNRRWLDLSSLFLFLAFMIVEVFTPYSTISELLAAALFVLHAIRLWDWYDHGIWRKAMLWVLYVGYSFIVLGFALKALTSLLGFTPWIAIHAFAAGGIGMITTGMMARVALGHTGHNVQQPPKSIKYIFALILLGAFIRVVFPLVISVEYYSLIIGAAQLFWVLGFSLFVVVYAPILSKPRIDQPFG